MDNWTVESTDRAAPLVVYGNASRAVWGNVRRPPDNAVKARSHTKRGPGRMPFRRRP